MMLPILADVAANTTAQPPYVLGISPVLFKLGFFELRWYSLAYIAGITVGWWYLIKLIDQPGSPMARRHADDLVFYATLGILLGGRLAYIAFYDPAILWDPVNGFHPLDALKLWEGGMSFHGGVIGVSLGLLWLARRHGLSWLRIHDYVACCVPFGLFFGRLANFINGELWGAPSSVPWAVRFPETINGVLQYGPPRHPSQLYEAALEGVVLFAILAYAFWRTDARYLPGRLVGLFLLFYGIFRFAVEFIREPDEQLVWFARETGLHMGQWLCLPMIAGGAWLVATARRRRVRVEPTAGVESVA